MATWYRVSPYTLKITAHEVVRETREFVTIKADRYNRRDYRHRKANEWFPTWKEAHMCLVERQQQRIESYRRGVVYYEQQLALVMEMEEPK